MTEQPAAAAAEGLDDPWHDQLVSAGESFGGPEVLAVVAAVTGVASFFGFGVMNGSVYIVPLFNGGQDDTSRLVLAALLGAALAMVPVWLGWRAVSRTLDTDPHWVPAVARAAIVIGLASGLLRLVVAVVQATHDGPSGFTRR